MLFIYIQVFRAFWKEKFLELKNNKKKIIFIYMYISLKKTIYMCIEKKDLVLFFSVVFQTSWIFLDSLFFISET